MPTDDERREVADEMREANRHGFYNDTDLVDEIEIIIGTNPCGAHAHLMTLYRLADLIEPEPTYGIYDAFPRIYWTKRNPMETIEDKVRKLSEETEEVLAAKDETELLDETLDVLHCCVDILREIPPELVEQAVLLHNAKNRKRGYYEPKVVSE